LKAFRTFAPALPAHDHLNDARLASPGRAWHWRPDAAQPG